MTRATKTTAQLEIDWTRCDGHGLCAALLPGLITRDEWGFPVFVSQPGAGHPVGADEERAVRRAVTVCPSLALRLTRP